MFQRSVLRVEYNPRLDEKGKKIRIEIIKDMKKTEEDEFEHLISPKYEIRAVVRVRKSHEMFLLTEDTNGDEMLWKPAAIEKINPPHGRT